ncbi:hypothetical protein [Ruminococcus flavefaciens]|uniref:Collagenase-like protease, PrtC family n=1 Tax=Ruminococcus flavefaciens TaxID=1265 RepID=A0A1M7M6S1_RUMFL|nr:hypothetical protein [Ruminococcus flavefaciens]SHM86435.1 hypothetical protein SAMN04487860_11933 [Ruminococcus flavefaciens]
MNQDSISFDLGCNFDYKLFDFVDQYDKKHAITSFFGKLKFDGLPGGRTASIIPDFTLDQLADYVKECQKRDITFNYLINPLSMDQNEIDPVVGKKIRDFIHQMYDLGIRAFTLNSPILIKYVKREFKDVFVTLGLYAYPTTIQHIEYWRNWGVDEITLDHGFNRKFDLLRKVLTQYKDTDLHLRVIANNLCLRECPFRLAHGCFVGHSDPELFSMDYSLVNCAYKKVTHPAAILTAEFIRPEDVHFYRELAEETGNKHFSIKLIDRTRTTDFLERVVKSYMAESYDGNLLDIVNWPQAKTIATRPDQAKEGLNVGAGGPPAGVPMGAGAPPMGMPPMGAGGPPMGMPAGGPPPWVMEGRPPRPGEPEEWAKKNGITAPPMGMPPMGAGGPPMGMPAGGPPPWVMEGRPPRPGEPEEWAKKNGITAPPAGMPVGGPPPGVPKMRWMERLKPEAMMAYGRTMHLPKVYVDNKKLDGFLEHFINNNNCANSLCVNDILEEGQTAPNACAHCSNWAKKVISYDEAEIAQWKGMCAGVLQSIEDGSIYRD